MSKVNKIDEIVNKAFEDFEMSYDASQWDLLQNKMDQMSSGNSFDNNVKNKLENHEVAYQPSAWIALESQLVSSTVSYSKWIVAAGVIGLISIGSYFIFSGEEKKVENNSSIESNKELAETKVNAPIKEEKSNLEVHSNIQSNSVVEVVEENSDNHTSNANDLVVTASNDNNSNNLNNNNTNNSNVTNVVIPNVVIEPVNNGSSVWQFATPKINGVTEICSSEKIQFVSSEISNNVAIIWKLNGIEVGNEKELNLVNLNPGQHEIELVHTATKLVETCSEPILSTKMYLNVKESPKVDFTYKQIGDAYYPETKFETLTDSEFDNLAWTIDGKSFTSEEAIYIFNKKGNYPVTVEATLENGCKIQESKNIEINNDYNLLAPIAFTPNSDGLNDDFIPEALKVLNLPFKMTVYDRNQGYVYQTSRVDAPWNGRNLNTNEICGQGTYLWVVELTNKKGEQELYSGTITLLK